VLLKIIKTLLHLCYRLKTPFVELIEKAGVTEPQTIKSYINAVLACFKYSSLQNTHQKAYECWSNTLVKVNNIAQENLKASPKQVDTYVPWDEIIKTRDKFDKDSEEYLLLSLYTMIPPSRADFNNIRIYKKEPTQAQKEKQNNYIIVQGDYMKLVFNEFKSKSKSLQTYENLLPPDLVKVIQH